MQVNNLLQISKICVIPAKAGIQCPYWFDILWIPAFAGMTVELACFRCIFSLYPNKFGRKQLLI